MNFANLMSLKQLISSLLRQSYQFKSKNRHENLRFFPDFAEIERKGLAWARSIPSRSPMQVLNKPDVA